MVRALLIASRPKTLPAAAVPVWLGCALAWGLSGAFSLVLAVCTLAAALCIQVATNFFNDAIDFRKGADTAERIGPTRASASGLLPPRLVLGLGGVALGLAGLFAWPLISVRGWPILAIGLPSLYFSFGYTGGPLPLAYRGLGEGFVLVFFGLVAVAGTVFVQIGAWPWEALLLGMQVGCFSTALIAINNLRDIRDDRRAGKRTLAVRFGEGWARRECAIFVLAPYALGLLWLLPGADAPAAAAVLPLAGLVLAVPLARWILTRPPGPAHNRALALASLALVVFGITFHAALALG